MAKSIKAKLVMDAITGVILASGFSRRMKKEKLLLDIGGMPMVERVIRAAKFSQIDNLLLIYQSDEIQMIARKHGIKTVYNHRAGEGQSAAVKLGVRSSPADTAGYLFLVGDQPYLNASIINNLIHIFKSGKHLIIVPLYNGKRGNPVIFSAKLRRDLLKLSGDCGGRVIIEKKGECVKLVNIEDKFIGLDIDKKEDYERIHRLNLNHFQQ
jgi:molybdenum cofactor cytidylyltransferase